MIKQLAKICLAVMITLLALVVIWLFRVVIIYVLISLALAAALRPLIQRLAGRSFVKTTAWIVLYLLTLGIFAFLVFLTSKFSLIEIQQLGNTLSARDAWSLPFWLQGHPSLNTLVSQLPSPSQLFEAVSGDKGQLVLPRLLGVTQDVAGFFVGFFVILIFCIYWISNQVHFERLWLSLLPSDQRKRARGIWRTIETNLGSYIRSQVIHSLLAGLLLALGYWILGSPFPVLIALIGAIACLVPLVGLPIALLPPLLLGLLTGWQITLFTVLYALVILVALAIWVKPRLFDRRWNNPILTLVILIGMASALGVIGIIIAPPISAIIQILWTLLVSHRKVAGAAFQISDLQERQEHVKTIVNDIPEPLPEVVTSSMARLSQLIEKAQPVLQANLLAADTSLVHLVDLTSAKPVRAEDVRFAPKNQTNINQRRGIK